MWRLRWCAGCSGYTTTGEILRLDNRPSQSRPCLQSGSTSAEYEDGREYARHIDETMATVSDHRGQRLKADGRSARSEENRNDEIQRNLRQRQ